MHSSTTPSRALAAAAVLATAGAVLLGGARPAAAATTLHVWLTTPDLVSRLTQQSDVTLGAVSSSPTVSTSSATRFQSIDGFGAAMTDASAFLLGTRLSATARTQVLNDLYSTSGEGIGLSLTRVPMGASDFRVGGNYSYDDTADSDALPNFSTAHDDAYVIPVLKQAQAVNTSLKLLLNPWSPPAWMKTNGSMNGTEAGATLLTTKYGALANYFVKTLQQYSTKGVKVWGITPQNEPNIDPATYPAMRWAASDEARFIANDLGPALDAAKLTPKILGGDTSIADVDYQRTLYASAASSRLAGSAAHCYQDDAGFADGLAAIHALKPALPLWVTECSTGPNGIAGNTAEKTLIATNNGAGGMILWNIALDGDGGPKTGVGCDGCTGLVTIDQSTGTYQYTVNYYELGQFSKFVRPGAQRIASTDGAGLWAQAYRNADGTQALVVHNTTSAAARYTANWDGKGSFATSIPAGATMTVTDVPAAQGAFTLKNPASGRCLDVPNGQTGAQVQIFDCTAANANQRITSSAGGELRVRGACLAADGDGTANGTKVILWPCNGKPSQQWTTAGNGTVKNTGSGLVLDVAKRGTANGSLVQLWAATGGTNQTWTRS